MIHSRLRRPIRLAVDCLTLRFTRIFANPRLPFGVLTQIHANAAAIPPPLALFSFPLARLSRAARLTTRLRLAHPQRHTLRVRRNRASIALVLALLLQLCGCNPVEYAGFAVGAANGSNATSDFAPIEQPLSFYDPTDASSVSGPPLTNLPDPQLLSIEAKPLPWTIPESVYLLYKSRRPQEHGDATRIYQLPVATAFVLSVPGHKPGQLLRFLVTARHVIDPQWAHCSARNPESIDVRLNRRTGGVDYETVVLQSGASRNFYTPADTTADLAVIPLDQAIIPNLDGYKFVDIPFRLLPTDAELRLVEAGLPVMTAGLSSPPYGKSGSYPIFDAGSLSKMPIEPVGVQCGGVTAPQAPAKLLHVWFINAGVPQGVSGAPVYTSLARGPGDVKSPVLLGIQSVDWPDKGVAGITPAVILADLIQSALNRSKLRLDFYRGPNPVADTNPPLY